MKIRLATCVDLPRVVEIHQQAFPSHFMTELGPRFLQQYYRCLLDYPQSIALIAEMGVAGPTGPVPKALAFCVGFIDGPSFYQQLRGRRWQLALSVLAQLLRKPTLLLALLKRYQTTTQRSQPVHSSSAGFATVTQQQSIAELSSIGCCPAGRGKGLGAALVREFLATAELANAELCSLTTDRDQNDSVRNFYRHLGFVEVGEESQQQGRPMVRYNYHYQQVAAA